MEVLKIDLVNYTREKFDYIIDNFRIGKVIIYPSDTIYGIGCLAVNQSAVKKIYKIKNRPKDKALIVLMKSYCMLHEYCFVSKKQDQYIRSIWPPTTRDLQSSDYKYNNKAATFIFKSRGKLPSEISAGQDSLAVRLPKNDFLMKILKAVNKPIVSTSINLSSQAEPKNFNSLENYYQNYKPDLVIDAGELKNKKASRLIDVRDINNIKIIRK